MANTIAEKIKKEANDLVRNLYGPDVAKMRRQLLAFHARAIKLTGGADSFVDEYLFRIIESKHTTGIVAGVLVAAFLLGRMS